MSRPKLALNLLIVLAVAGSARAQTRATVPPPPPPGNVTTPALEGPTTELEPIPSDGRTAPEKTETRDAATTVATHDALAAGESRSRASRVSAPTGPPAPIAERPSGARPEPRAVWVSGYWDFDPERSEFFWVGGLWKVPPPSGIWVNSRWVRDQEGWYRAPGFWSRRREPALVATEFKQERDQPAWRVTGPPADHPVEQPTAAPGPDYFYVPGHYFPAGGDQLSWKPGFWTRSQPGWDWVPARWVRRASGWDFRAGHWVREPDEEDINGREDEDPIAQAEAGIGMRDRRAIVVVPGNRMPYYMIRPPGLYGPTGVVVPGVVPGFVREILDRVLP